MSFKALVLRKEDGAQQKSAIETLTSDDLPNENVHIKVQYSTLNYKDGLCVTSGGGLIRNYPHVPGVDFSGTVIESGDSRYNPGDEILVSGWRIGEIYWGGYAQEAKIRGDFLVPKPKSLSHHQAMAIGTAGLTAMYGLMTLERQGINPESGPILVTGAAGGVGSIAVAILVAAGYEVHAVSGRLEATPYLESLGATAIIAREDISETVKRPLETETWAGVIDNVGGPMLARVLGQMKYNGVVAAIGLAGGADLPASVIPFLLRGVQLIGIDSVMRPYEDRVEAWERLSQSFPFDKLDQITQTRPLADVPELAAQILKGQVRGRIVIDVNV